MYGDGCKLDSCDHFVINTNIEPLCCTPETNIVLHVNYISVLKWTTFQGLWVVTMTKPTRDTQPYKKQVLKSASWALCPPPPLSCSWNAAGQRPSENRFPFPGLKGILDSEAKKNSRIHLIPPCLKVRRQKGKESNRLVNEWVQEKLGL